MLITNMQWTKKVFQYSHYAQFSPNNHFIFWVSNRLMKISNLWVYPIILSTTRTNYCAGSNPNKVLDLGTATSGHLTTK